MRLPVRISHQVITTVLLALSVLAACTPAAKPPPRPNGIVFAPDGSLYAMALGAHQVIRLSPEGRVLSSFGKLGMRPSDIYEGWGTALDQAGNIYICHRWRNEDTDVDHESVKVFTPQGKLLRDIATPGNHPEGCYSVDVDPQGRIFVVYSTTNKLRVFDPQGALLATFWGATGFGPGEYFGLRDIALDTQRGLLYASDAGNSRIQQFSYEPSATGSITLTNRMSFGTYGRGPDRLAYPQYLAVDEASGLLAVGDMANRRIQIFDPEGQPVREFAPPGVKDWQVMGLAFGSDGAVYAADALNSVIWVFEPDGQLRRQIEVPS